MTVGLTVAAAGGTHLGLVRRRNEDAHYVGSHLIAVADGLGGHPAGDIASATAIEAVSAFDRPAAPDELVATMGRAILTAHREIGRRTAADPRLAGMGTTLVAMLWSGTCAVVANVGDSRVYRRGGRATEQITEDHTYAHLLADAGAVPELGERLTRWLDGRTDGRSPDLSTWQIRPGDRFLLCSDGLSSYVPVEEIGSAVQSADSAQAVVDRLIAAALDHGAPDNVTVVVADFTEHYRAQLLSIAASARSR